MKARVQELITQILDRTKEGEQHAMLLEKKVRRLWRNLNGENQWGIVWYSDLHDIIRYLLLRIYFFNNILISRMWYIIFAFNLDIQYSSKAD